VEQKDASVRAVLPAVAVTGNVATCGSFASILPPVVHVDICGPWVSGELSGSGR